jgi:hypothetical protein
VKVPTIAERVAALSWPELHAGLDARGFAQTPPVVSAADCRALSSGYETRGGLPRRALNPASRGIRPDRLLGGKLTERREAT